VLKRSAWSRFLGFSTVTPERIPVDISASEIVLTFTFVKLPKVRKTCAWPSKSSPNVENIHDTRFMKTVIYMIFHKAGCYSEIAKVTWAKEICLA